jgi:hypothetical protein
MSGLLLENASSGYYMNEILFDIIVLLLSNIGMCGDGGTDATLRFISLLS